MTDRHPHSNDSATELDLNDVAGHYDIPSGDLDRVVARGRRLATRRRRGVVTLTAVAVVATGIAAVNVLTPSADHETPVAAGGGNLSRGAAGIQWQTANPDLALGMSSEASGGSASLYALSTAAGEIDFAKARRNGVLWRSDNGVDWAAASTLPTDLYLSDLAGDDDRLYAVGTTAPTAASGAKAVPDLIAGWSDDAGRTFSRTTLPIDLRALAAHSTHSGVSTASVASGARGTLIVVTLNANLDVPKLVPDGVSARYGWVFSDTGVELLAGNTPVDGSSCAGMEDGQLNKVREVGPTDMGWFRCGDPADPASSGAKELFGVSHAFTWADLGIEGDVLMAVRHEPVLFHAPAGSTAFERVPLPDSTVAAGQVLVEAHDGGFEIVAAAAYDRAPKPVVVMHSDDGRTFGEPRALPDIVWASSIGRVRGVTTIVGGTDIGSAVVQADGTGGWVSRDIASAVDPKVLGNGQAHVIGAGMGDFGIVAAVVVSDERRDQISYRLLASRDGTTWEDRPLQDMVDDAIRSVTRVVVTSNRAVVSVAVGAPGKDRRGPSKQVALVGVAT